MFDINKLYAAVDKFAPFSVSEEMIRRGEYDNSGIIVKTHDNIKAVLFSLDLSEEAVKKAKRLSCDTIITHHPAIYYPVKSLSVDDKTTAAVILSAEKGLNVISAHLNLDAAEGGIDACLAECLGAKSYKIIDRLDEKHGYGREFAVNIALSEMKKRIKENLNTNKAVVYGKSGYVVKKCASFCGGGAGHALEYVKSGKTDADLIISSDMPHHIIKELTEYGKSIIILPHYPAEEYGFKKFYERVSSELPSEIKSFYFCDKSFF